MHASTPPTANSPPAPAQRHPIHTQGTHQYTLDTKYHNSTRPDSTQPLPKVHTNTPPNANTPHNAALPQANPTEGAQLCTLGMIYRHPISPKGTQSTPKVHNNAPPTADIAAVAPQHRPIPIEGTQMRSLGEAHIRQHHPNSTQPTSKAHSSAPSTPAVLPPGKTIISRPCAPPHSTGPPHIRATQVCPTPCAAQVGRTAPINRASVYAKGASLCDVHSEAP